eukprot:m.309359 g.309359  ORF g.309359 m.309359 type:complete len:104 (-) comp27425_c0_seq8:269-580(-)
MRPQEVDESNLRRQSGALQDMGWDLLVVEPESIHILRLHPQRLFPLFHLLLELRDLERRVPAAAAHPCVHSVVSVATASSPVREREIARQAFSVSRQGGKVQV